ncbi:MAG TPA: hypothetical protein VD962_05950 [Rubricoccaceae bacterium]|nr:hypothetical protein [Rubricoccaceae bacterium]
MRICRLRPPRPLADPTEGPDRSYEIFVDDGDATHRVEVTVTAPVWEAWAVVGGAAAAEERLSAALAVELEQKGLQGLGPRVVFDTAGSR